MPKIIKIVINKWPKIIKIFKFQEIFLPVVELVVVIMVVVMGHGVLAAVVLAGDGTETGAWEKKKWYLRKKLMKMRFVFFLLCFVTVPFSFKYT